MNVKDALTRIYDLFGVEYGKTNHIQRVVPLDEYNMRVRPTLLWLWDLSITIDPNSHHNVDEARLLNAIEEDIFEADFRKIKIFCDIPICAVKQCGNKRHETTAYCEKHQEFVTEDEQFIARSYQFFVDRYEEDTENIHFPDSHEWMEWCDEHDIDCELMQADIRRKFPNVIKE